MAQVDQHDDVEHRLPAVPHLEIAVEAPGLTETVPVDSPARPGAVRAAVEKALRDLGLTRL